MKNILKYEDFLNEVKTDYSTDHIIRSGRLLTQEQLMCNELYEGVSKFPAIMFTDVVGSSQMWSDDTLVMKERIDSHFDLINDIAKKHDGFVVKTIGDAFMIYFEDSEDTLERSIECGINILRAESLPLRIGICEGGMQEKTYVLQNAKLKDYFGNVVNVASRMESKVADPEGIAFSSMLEVPKSILDKYNPLELTGKQIPDLKGASINNVYKIKS